MKLIITIEMGNAAFEEETQEIMRILNRLVDDINVTGELAHNLRDINGNAVGTSKVIDKHLSEKMSLPNKRSVYANGIRF